MEFGLKSGIKRDDILLGVTANRSIKDYRYKIFEPNGASSTGNLLNRSHLNIGFFCSLEFVNSFYFTGSYYFLSRLTIESDDSGSNPTSKGDEYKGSGFELGLGYKLSEDYRINIFWRKINFNEFEDGPTNVRVGLPSGANKKAYTHAIFIGIEYFLNIH